MSDTESQASEYCTAPTSPNPSQQSPGAAEDDNNANNVTAEREKSESDSFGLFDNLPSDVTLSRFLPAAVQINMLSFITGKDSLEQPMK